MASTQPGNAEGEEKVQTTNQQLGSENCSGMHNPKVTGSNPVPATGSVTAGRSVRPHRLAAKDIALSRRRHGFESRWGYLTGGSSNGRTADSGSVGRGSNPCPPACCNLRLARILGEVTIAW